MTRCSAVASCSVTDVGAQNAAAQAAPVYLDPQEMYQQSLATYNRQTVRYNEQKRQWDWKAKKFDETIGKTFIGPESFATRDRMRMLRIGAEPKAPIAPIRPPLVSEQPASQSDTPSLSPKSTSKNGAGGYFGAPQLNTGGSRSVFLDQNSSRRATFLGA